MAERVCPPWIGYLLASPIRRLLHNPCKILSPYVRDGMTVLEPGPGMGFFTLELARMVGPTGRVVALDMQPKMLKELKRRAVKIGLAERVDARQTPSTSLGVTDLVGKVDFVLAFAVVHEMPSADVFFSEVAATMKPGACLLFAEPDGHVKRERFQAELNAAERVGLETLEHPSVRHSLTALLKKAS